MMTDDKKTPEEIRDTDLDQASGGFTATDDLWKVRKGFKAPDAPDHEVVSGPIPLPTDKN